MRRVFSSVIEAVGDTPIVRLNRLTDGLKAKVYVKLEYTNPGGSVKDRIALKMIEAAEREGKLKPGGTIVESTSGNTGAGLAMVAATRGYKCIFVMPDKMSAEKVSALKAYGAEVVLCPTSVEATDPRSYYSVSRRLGEEVPGAFYTNQYKNAANPQAHYESTGPEVWGQMGTELDVLVCGLGTGGTITGTGKYLKEKKPSIQVVGVDPVGSLYYDYFKIGKQTVPSTYKVEGIGEDFLPTTIDFQFIDDVIRVTDSESFHTTRDLARMEGIVAGGSCGAAVAGALKYARKMDREMNILVILPDSGSKYMSKIYNDEWLKQNGFAEREPNLGQVGDLIAGRAGRPLIKGRASDSLKSVVERMRGAGVSQVPVVDDAGHIVGLLDEQRVIDVLMGGTGVGVPVGDLVEGNYCIVEPDTEIVILTELLARSQVAFVLKDGEVIDIIAKMDLIEYLAGRR